MEIRRAWVLSIGALVGAFLIAACGSSSTSTSSPLPTSTTIPVSTPSPTSGESPSTVVPPATPGQDSTAAPSGEQGGTPAGYTWQLETVHSNGAKPSIAVDANGNPHIAFIIEARPGFVKYAVQNDSKWDITTVSKGYFYGPLDIQVDAQGGPRIAYHNHDNKDAAYAVLVDGEWVVSEISHPGHDGWDTNLAIDSQGFPHITGVDPEQFGSTSGVEYAVFDGQTWKVESISDGPEPYEFGTYVVVDGQDQPHVVWFNAENKDLKYAVKIGGAWETTTVDSQGDVGRYASLALDSDGNPAISYYEATGDSSGYIKVARFDGSEWQTERIDKLDGVFTGFFGARKTSALVIDTEGNPIVAYSDEKVVKLAVWDGSAWIIDTLFTSEGTPWGQQVSLGIDSDDGLHLTFADVSNKGQPGVSGNIKYARGTKGAVAAINSPSDTGSSGSRQQASSSDSAAPALEVVAPDPDFRDELSKARFSRRGWGTDFSLHTVPFSDITSGGPGKDGIPPLDDPQFVSPASADEWLNRLEPVISLEINGEAKAYPLQILTWHEVANDVVGGVPVVVTFCPLCNTAIAFERTLDGVVHTFGVSGNLRNSDLIMWDRQTESWWQQLTGEGIVGSQAGKRLTFLSAPIVSWEDFKTAHPDGKVLSRDTGFGRPYGQNPYVGYDRVDNPPFLFRGDLDGRLLPKERVAAFIIGDTAVAFPFPVLDEERVVNYSVGGSDVVVFFKPGTRSALGGLLIGEADEIGATGVFDAFVEGSKLTFRPEGDTFIDNETGTTWSILGKAVDGPMAGKALTPIVHGNHFWFSWGVFRPETKIYQGRG